MAGTPIELIAVEVRADVDQLRAQMPGAARVVDQSMDQVERSVVSAERQVSRSSTQIARGFDQASYRSRLLGYQIGDIGTQLASGGSPFLVLAQQAPQVANALEGTTGAAGRMAAFFSGPWGAALLAAASIAGMLAGKLLDARDAAVETASDLQKAMDALYASQSQASALSNVLTEATQERVGALAKEAALTKQIAQTRKAYESAVASAPEAAAGLSLRLESLTAQRDRAIEEARAADRAARSAMEATRVAGAVQQRNRERFEAAPAAPASGRGSRATVQVDRAALQAQKQAEQEERAYQAVLRRLQIEQELADIRAAGTAEAEKRADIMEANYRLEEQFPELASSVLQADRERLQILKDIAAATISQAYARKDEADRIKDLNEGLKKVADDYGQKIQRDMDEAARRQEDQIYTLAGAYYRAFQGGTQGIWRDFKETGFAVIAEVLARFTLSQINGGGFNFGDALGSAIGAVLPGFATGGSMRIGGRGGTDRNVLSLNGSPIAKVSAGEVLNVTNPALSRGGSQPQQVTVLVQANDYFDARVAGVSRQVAEPIARQNAAQAGQAAYQKSMKDAPGRIRQAQRYGK